MSQNPFKRKRNPGQSSKGKGVATSSEFLSQPTHSNKLFQLFDGEENFSTNCIGRAIIPTGTRDRRVTKTISSLLYNFKNRLPINLPVIIGSHMNYAIFNAKTTTLPYGVGSSLGNVNENVEDKSDGDENREADVGGEDVVHRARLDAQELRQKKDRKYLKGLLKFMKCFGKGKGPSVEAQRHLDHSDSDPEVDEHQTISGTPVLTNFIILLQVMTMVAWGSFRVIRVAFDSDGILILMAPPLFDDLKGGE
ncbi:hypothetical protein LIER_27744 [Lithospermum erythrorhizon]|uniref:Uncharacterized protein n=1 Tax=Lithospermum erythrorhizon TaxID=34254 RepID=A0AAV3RD34_LITER